MNEKKNVLNANIVSDRKRELKNKFTKIVSKIVCKCNQYLFILFKKKNFQLKVDWIHFYVKIVLEYYKHVSILDSYLRYLPYLDVKTLILNSIHCSAK